MQPRLAIPFDGAIDVNTVNSKTVFLISLGDTLNQKQHEGEVVGINQVVWDAATTTLFVGSDAVLAQHTRYALIVTNGIHDAKGNPVQTTQEFRHFRRTVYGGYNHDLRHAIHAAHHAGVPEQDIVVASVFTTLSATAILEKIRDQVHAATPAAADFLLGPSGARTVFNREDVTGIHWEQQTGANPPSFTPVELDVSLLDIVPGAVGQIAFGKYLSPDYEVHPGEYIPAVGTSTGTPAVQGMNEIYFNLFLPSGPKPASGWPVAIFGHGNAQSKNGGPQSAAPHAIATKMAEQGIATIAINAVGHGFGPLGTLTVSQQGGAAVTLPAGGRGIDQNGDHIIAATEGIEAVAPRSLMFNRDGVHQTVVDLMQLVRVIQVGMDVDGDGTSDLDPARIYYVGISLGGQYGTLLLAIEPAIGTAVLNVPAGNDLFRHGVVSPVFRPTVSNWLSQRVPVLLNPPGVIAIDGVPVSGPFFNDHLPLPGGGSFQVGLEDGSSRVIQSPLVNDVPGAIAIQKVLDNAEWVMLSSASLAYVPHLRTAPLAGIAPKSILVQFAKGDQSVPNPFTSALLRAGDLADRATFYRHDLAYAENPSLPKFVHPFLSSVSNPGLRDIALGAQEQVAAFFASDGKEIIHPEPQRFFEVPIIPPLPEDLNYIP
jgi:hypothetical protein